jgi:hypothetical protein
MVTIKVRIAPGAGREMKALTPVMAYMGFFRDISVDASILTEVSFFCHPDSGEVGTINLNGGLGNDSQFLIQRASAKKLFLQGIELGDLHLRSFPLGNVH